MFIISPRPRSTAADTRHLKNVLHAVHCDFDERQQMLTFFGKKSYCTKEADLTQCYRYWSIIRCESFPYRVKYSAKVSNIHCNFSSLHCVSKKNDNDIAHYNFNAH